MVGVVVAGGKWGAEVGDHGPLVGLAVEVSGWGHPEWKAHAEVFGQRQGVGLVEQADGG